MICLPHVIVLALAALEPIDPIAARSRVMFTGGQGEPRSLPHQPDRGSLPSNQETDR